MVKFMEREIMVNGTMSGYMLEEYVKDNCFARFHDPRYYRYREKHLNILLDVKF